MAPRQRPLGLGSAAAATAAAAALLLAASSAHATTGHEPHLRGLGAATDGGRQAGVYYGPDAMLGGVQLALEDKRAAVEYDVEADGKAQPGTTWPNCQWHVKFGFNFTSQGLIDPNAIYYAELLSGPMMGRAYKIKGRFPPTIYFSWQLYNSLFTGEAAQGTTDYKIKPHWGKNPFNDGSATPFDTGGYELYLTPSGTEGYPNELRLPRGMTNTLILRMYKPDPILGEKFPVEEIDPPVLYVGQTLNDGRREWRALPPCSHDQEILVDRAATGFYQINYPQNTGTFGRGVILRDYNCPLNPKRGNVSFVLFEGAWLTPQVQNLVARQSSDSPYLFYCINPDNDWEYYTNTVFKFRFKLPTLPDGLYEPIKVANVGDYDLRYLSIMTAESVLPQPTIQAIDGQGIKRFYHQKRGAQWDGWVEVRVALNEQKAKECGFWDDNAVFLPLASERVGPAKSITLVVRSVLAHGPKTAGAASRACNKTVNCGNPGFIRNVMQEQYPELEVYQCEGGKLRRYADYFGAV